MAVVQPTVKPLGGGAVLVEWPALASGDSGEAISLTEYRDKTVQVEGTITTFVLEGTNAPAGTNYQTLRDVDNTTPLDNAASWATQMHVIKENPLKIRPRLTTGSAVIVRITAK